MLLAMLLLQSFLLPVLSLYLAVEVILLLHTTRRKTSRKSANILIFPENGRIETQYEKVPQVRRDDKWPSIRSQLS